MSRDTLDDDLDNRMLYYKQGLLQSAFGRMHWHTRHSIEWKILDALGFDPINPDSVAGYMVIEICNKLNCAIEDELSKDQYGSLKRMLVKRGEYLIVPATKWENFHTYLTPIFQDIFPTLHSFRKFIKTNCFDNLPRNYLGTIEEFKHSNQRIETLWRLITEDSCIVYHYGA